MFDECERLREHPVLHALLTHYAEAAKGEKQAWQDRVMRWQECEGRELTRMHGALLAFGFLEQNTGEVVRDQMGEASGCYRLTHAGWRALRQLRGAGT